MTALSTIYITRYNRLTHNDLGGEAVRKLPINSPVTFS